MPVTTGRLVRVAVLAVTGIALLWLSVANSVSLVLERDSPKIAQETGLPSAEANAREALLIAGRQPSAPPAQIARASRLARAALRREPINVTAVVALATIASLQQNDALANEIFSYSERLSRHDPATQLWLIENRVAAGDVAGALIHYDRLMSVTPAFRPTLIPILVTAARDPAIALALGDILKRRPLWWTDALVPLIFQSPEPAITLPILLQRLRLDPARDQERAFVAAAITRLANAGAFDEAQALYLRSGGKRVPGPEQVRNGGFETENRLPPFDWDLHNEDGRSAMIQSHPDNKAGSALFLYVDPDHQGDLARQLLLLPPGTYRLSAQSGDIAGDALGRPQLRISCAASKNGSVPLDLRLPASTASAGTRSDFVVPAGCPAQWLSLASGLDSSIQDTPPWIDDISITPVKKS